MAGNNPNMNLGYSILFWLLYVLAYWPLYLTYLTFEIVKMVITRLNYLTIPTFLLVFGFENWKASKLGANNIFVLRKIFMKKEWRECVTNFWHQEALYSFEFKIQSFIYIIVILSIFVILPLLKKSNYSLNYSHFVLVKLIQLILYPKVHNQVHIEYC